MRIFEIVGNTVREVTQYPLQLPEGGMVWIACSREEFSTQIATLQATLLRLSGLQLVDLHISDLLNQQLPSRYDYTAQYDLMVFRRLAAAHGNGNGTGNGNGNGNGTGSGNAEQVSEARRRSGPPILRRIDTNPVGFAIFERLLLTVHPNDCQVREAYASRLMAAAADPGPGNRVPTSAADLMLRIVSLAVDGYLDLRREMSRQLEHWQEELLAPGTRFTNWSALLQARLALHALDDISEDQRTALQDWIAALEDWPAAATPAAQREHDLLKVRSRDVLEHIERVVRHVRRLEQNTETTLQMHFNAQGHRTNEIMRTLTVLTAIFLPLNLITGFFGMNFDFLPLVHRQAGIWWALGIMTAVGLGFVGVFWRKRYLARTSQ